MEALAFLDLLGFSHMVSTNTDRAKEILGDFYNISFGIIKREPAVQGNLFSDSLLAHSSNPALLVNVVAQIYRECLKKNDTYHHDLSKFFLLPRGGISIGHVDIQHLTTAPNITKNFIVSPALVHSAKIEGEIKGGRMLVADFEENAQQQFNWNGDVKSLLYENSSFTLWKNFKYFDALWFLDISKQHNQQKIEVEDLIASSISLVRANAQSKKNLEQHLHTLRIGLLSYTKFLTPNSNPLLRRVIEDFSDDKYWLIWLTIFEMIMQCHDSWAFPTEPMVVSFYKEVSLKPSWSKVIDEIHKPNNEYQKVMLQKFVDELSIVVIEE